LCIVAPNRDRIITPELLKEFQLHLYKLCCRGVSFGPVLMGCIFGEGFDDWADIEVDTMDPIDLQQENETIGEFFGLGGTSRRQLYESNVNALLQHHSIGALYHLLTAEEAAERSRPHEQMCGRCASERHKKKFKSCRTSFVNGNRLLHGTCTNCIFNGGATSCSMTSKFLNHTRTTLFLLSRIVLIRNSESQVPDPTDQASAAPASLTAASTALSNAPIALRTRTALGVSVLPATRLYLQDSIAWCSLGNLDLPSEYCSVQDKDFKPKRNKQPLDLLKWVDGIPSDIEEEERVRTKALQKAVNKKKLAKQLLAEAAERTERLENLRSRRAERKRAAQEAAQETEEAAQEAAASKDKVTTTTVQEEVSAEQLSVAAEVESDSGVQVPDEDPMDIDPPEDLASAVATDVVMSEAVAVPEATNEVAAENGEHSEHTSDGGVTTARPAEYASMTKNQKRNWRRRDQKARKAAKNAR